MKLAATADRIAADLYHRPLPETRPQAAWVRDACDTATGSDLSTSMLDRLCDMVERRLRNMPIGA